MFAMTTDTAPDMVGRQKGAAKLIEENVGHPTKKMCAKMLNSDLNQFLATVAKFINCRIDFIVDIKGLAH